MNEKTHYRKAFNSPYLSSADIVNTTTLTIKHVRLEPDKTKKTKDLFNTAYFTEKEIRPGEPLKPMILNACNSKTLAGLADSKFIDDWNDIRVNIYVDPNVRFGRDLVEGLRISEKPPVKVEAATNGQLQFISESRDKLKPAEIKYIETHDLTRADADRLIKLIEGRGDDT